MLPAQSAAVFVECRMEIAPQGTGALVRLGGQIAVLGSVDRVVVGPEIRNYDVYAFVFYPSQSVGSGSAAEVRAWITAALSL